MELTDTWPPRWKGPAFKHTQPLQVEVRKAKKVSAARRLAAAYADVDARDGKRCQVRGTRLLGDSADEWRQIDRHHLDEKSTAPERKFDPDNILTTSRAVHRLMQAHKLLAVDAKGEETTFVSKIAGFRWNERLVKKPPFRLPNGKAA